MRKEQVTLPSISSWVWAAIRQSPVDFTRFTESFIAWVLARLFESHPERMTMLYYYIHIHDKTARNDRHRITRFLAASPNVVALSIILANSRNARILDYSVYGTSNYCQHQVEILTFSDL